MTYEASPQAREAIQRVYDDPRLDQLADRIEQILDLLDNDPGNIRLRKNRMHVPKLWAVSIHGSGEDFVIFWEPGDDGQPFLRYAGPPP